MFARLAGVSALAAAAWMMTSPVAATERPDGRAQFGPVLEASAEFGGDNIAEVFYTNGTTQNIKAGQGVTLSAGAHYQPAASLFDFTATVGYKFVRTAASNANLGIDRVVVKLTGSYTLPNNFWLAAGPVWHVGTKFKGDGYVPDVDFDDALGVTVGAGWRWVGISCTSIRYRSSLTGGVDGSNFGVTFAWKL
jgi:hypothetical protein